MKYRHIGMAVLFLISYFGINFLFALFGFDPIMSTTFADIVISALGILYMRQLSNTSHRKCSWSYVWYICILSFFVWLFSQITATWALTAYGDASFDTYQSSVAINPVAFLFLTIFFAPVAEEVMMRGVVYGSLKRALPVWAAYVISSFAFAVMHGTMVHIIVGFVCGLLFTVVYEYTGSIASNIVLHMFYNTLSVMLGGIALPNILFEPLVFIPIDVILICVIIADIIRVQRVNAGLTADVSVSAESISSES